MALRGTLTHRKTRRLARLLDIDEATALGILESLWHVAGEQAKDGGIGRMSNADIIDEMFCRRDPDTVINALVGSGWLEELDSCRLYIHDWHDHSDDATDLFLARNGSLYANGFVPRMKRLSSSEREKLCAQNQWPEPGTSARVPQKATKSHKKPLPEPEPEPEPEETTSREFSTSLEGKKGGVGGKKTKPAAKPETNGHHGPGKRKLPTGVASSPSVQGPSAAELASLSIAELRKVARQEGLDPETKQIIELTIGHREAANQSRDFQPVGGAIDV